jgi:anti-anti-sigma factor
VLDHLGVAVTALSEEAVELSFSGDIDAVTRDDFAKALREAIVNAGRVVNLDLSQVNCMAAEGLNTLLGMYLLAIEARVSLRVVKASEPVRRILDLMGLAKHLD